MTTYASQQQTRLALLDSQRRVLERIASGAPLREILENPGQLIEEQADGMRCACCCDNAQESSRFARRRTSRRLRRASPFLRIRPTWAVRDSGVPAQTGVHEDTGLTHLWGLRDIAVRNGLRAICRPPFSRTTMPSGTLPCIREPDCPRASTSTSSTWRRRWHAWHRGKGNEEKIQACRVKIEDRLRSSSTRSTMAWSFYPTVRLISSISAAGIHGLSFAST